MNDSGGGEDGGLFRGAESQGQGGGAVAVAVGCVGGAVLNGAVGGDGAVDGMEIFADWGS